MTAVDSIFPFHLSQGASLLLGVLGSMLILLIYMPIADRLNIIDKPNQRSSHTTPIILGGGIVYPIVIALGTFLFNADYLLFLAGVALLAIVSFIDDRTPLPSVFRLGVHLIAVIAMLLSAGILKEGMLAFAIALILVIGWINTFNFMDGINGITALYSLSIMLSSYLAYDFWGLNLAITGFIEWLLLLGIGASIAFSFFNVRKRARCFAGDVGSISLALFLAFAILQLVAFVNFSFIGFLLVYGIDSVLTIFHRILKKENILEAHRSHLYQYLANEMKWGHLPVSFTYFFIQVGVSTVLIKLALEDVSPIVAFVSVAIPMVVFYIWARVRVLKKISE